MIKKQYAIWVTDIDDTSYYLHYDSIEDALSNTNKKSIEIFEAVYKSIGKYKLQAKPVKVKKKNGKN